LTVPTAVQAAPLRVIGPGQIVAALANCGRCDRLGLSGRPPLPLGSLMSSRLYRVGGNLLLALPAFADRAGGYLALDNRLLRSAVEAELKHLQRHWRAERGLPGQPVLVWPVGSERLDAPGADALLDFLAEVAAGRVPACRWAGVAGVAAAQPPLPLDGWADGLDPTAPWGHGAPPPGTAEIDTLGWDEAATRPLTPQRAAALERVRDAVALRRQLERSRNPYEQIEILGLLCGLEREVHGDGPATSLGGRDTELPMALLERLQAVARRAARERLWGVLRRAAGWLDWHDAGLELAVTRVMVHRKRLALGRAYSEGAILDRPLAQAAIVDTVRRYGGTDVRVRVLIEEVVCLLGLAMQDDAAPFQGTLTLRPWSLVTLLAGWLAREHGVTQAEAFEHLLDLSPHALLVRLREVIRREKDLAADLLKGHHLDAGPGAAALTVVQYHSDGDPVLDASDAGGWHAWREMRGAITRVPEGFHARVWELLHHCNGLVIADQFDIRNRLDSRLLRADSTRSEIGFALLVDDLLHKIQAPDYRQLTVEAVGVLSDLCAANPDLQVDGLFVVDVVIGSAVRLGWQGRLWREAEEQGVDASLYREQVAEAWQAFYASPPHRVANLISAAARHLLVPEPAAGPTAQDNR
ncbi:MAG TPA: hypothetical protein PKE61_02310, partial [Burkholderiaceae bacterium]|nr:hypothetical protein [Burkholderiaceae bacterium]